MKKSILNFEKVLYQLVLYKYNLEKTNEKVTTQVKNINEINNDVKCPRCGSTQIAAKKKGFGLGKAVVGGLLLGPFGLLGGAIGSNKTIVVCIKCGREWTV